MTLRSYVKENISVCVLLRSLPDFESVFLMLGNINYITAIIKTLKKVFHDGYNGI